MPFVESPYHAHSGIGRATPPKSYDEMLYASTESVGNQFADSIRRGLQRTSLCLMDERYAGCGGHLDYGRLPIWR